jgi:hypothetical protein
MNDNARFVILFAILSDGFAARGFAGVEFAQNNQPTQQGTPTAPTITLSKLPEVPLGWVRRDSVFDPDTSTMTDTELQTMQATYQVNALVTQDPADVSALTAMDYLRAARRILQSSDTIARLRGDGLAILRINELRSLAFVDDRDRYEYSPSFDFTLTYDELDEFSGNVVETVEHKIYRV